MPDSVRPDHHYVKLEGEEALAKLRAGEELNGYEIGSLTLSGEFEKEVVVRGCSIRRLTVQDATFAARVQIRGCHLYRPHFGKGTHFRMGLDLRNSRVYMLIMDGVESGGALRMDNAVVEKNARWSGCAFHGEVRLWQTRFHEWVTFSNCTFHTKADFRSFSADEGFELQGCHFHGDVLVRGSSVAKKFNFGDSRFEGLLDLSKAKLHDYTYMEEIQLGEGARFAFSNTVGDRVLVGEATLEGRIASEERGEHAEAKGEFAFLKRNFETLHRHEDEDWAFYRFKVNQRQAQKTSWLRPWTKLGRLISWLFLDWGCGYGVRPFRAVATAAVLIVLFGLIYMSGTGMFEVGTQPLPDLPPEHVLNRSLFGMATSVSVFTAGFTGDHLRSAHGWMLVPLAVEALLGTLLWGLFVVAFSRKVIR